MKKQSSSVSDMMMELSKLMRLGLHEAILVTVNDNGNPNPAPMGIKLEFLDNRYVIVVKPYLNTKTYQNLLRSKVAAILITQDYKLFLQSLYRKDEIKYTKSPLLSLPIVVENVDYIIECVVEGVERESNHRARVSLIAKNLIKGLGSELSYSRVNSFMIEALVYLTKVEDLCSSYHYAINVMSNPYQQLLNYASLVLINLSNAHRLANEFVKEDIEYLAHRLLNVLNKCFSGDE